MSELGTAVVFDATMHNNLFVQKMKTDHLDDEGKNYSFHSNCYIGVGQLLGCEPIRKLTAWAETYCVLELLPVSAFYDIVKKGSAADMDVLQGNVSFSFCVVRQQKLFSKTS